MFKPIVCTLMSTSNGSFFSLCIYSLNRINLSKWQNLTRAYLFLLKTMISKLWFPVFQSTVVGIDFLEVFIYKKKKKKKYIPVLFIFITLIFVWSIICTEMQWAAYKEKNQQHLNIPSSFSPKYHFIKTCSVGWKNGADCGGYNEKCHKKQNKDKTHLELKFFLTTGPVWTLSYTQSNHQAYLFCFILPSHFKQISPQQYLAWRFEKLQC